MHSSHLRTSSQGVRTAHNRPTPTKTRVSVLEQQFLTKHGFRLNQLDTMKSQDQRVKEGKIYDNIYGFNRQLKSQYDQKFRFQLLDTQQLSTPNLKVGMDSSKGRNTLSANIQMIKKDIQYKKGPKQETNFQAEMLRVIV